MSKRRRQRSSGALVVGVAWFDREQWHQLCQVAVDRSKLDDTFEEWEANARQALADLKSVGVNAEPFEVGVAAPLQEFSERNLPVDGASRAEYVSFMLKRKRSGA